MAIQRIKGIEQIKATQGRVALRYGPLIYSAESVDQKLDGILSPDTALTTEWKGDLLEGVMAIKGKWNDGSDFMAIPNYARENRRADQQPQGQRRGLGSSVWLKDR
jgi:hypothetical protein